MVFGETRDKVFHVIYNARQTLTDAQLNYATTEKEILRWHMHFKNFGLTSLALKLLPNESFDSLISAGKERCQINVDSWVLLFFNSLT